MPNRKPPYDFEDYQQAAWPLEPGSLVYLHQAGPHFGQPGRLVQCWPPVPMPPGHDGEERQYHYWRGRVRLDDGTEVDAWELEIAVLTDEARARHA